MNYREAFDYIHSHTWSQWRLGLDRTRELLQKLGNPQKKLKFIHIAGSNGKGSTAAMTERILREAGYVTGLYSSPHIVSFRERMQCRGVMISEEELAEHTGIVAQAADSMEDHPSQFEIITAVAMLFFAAKQCDMVVLEVGLGGEFDATNVIDAPEVCVITNITLEHTAYLGDTLEKIAATKAGIIKQGADVVLYESAPEVTDVVREKCEREGCRMTLSPGDRLREVQSTLSGHTFSYADDAGSEVAVVLSLPGAYQLRNAETALTVIDVLRNRGYEISKDAVRRGMANVTWPARFEVLAEAPLFLLDGGHNRQCAEVLTSSLQNLFPGKRFQFLIGVLSDKDVAGMLSILLPFTEDFLCVTVDSERAMAAEEIALLLKEKGAEAAVFTSVEDAVQCVYDSGKDTVAFGSLYMAGDVRNAYRALLMKDVAKRKKAMRKEVSARRASLPADARKEKSARICTYLKELRELGDAKVIFSYMAMEEEADLTEFHRRVMENGTHLAFPVTGENGMMEARVPEEEDVFFIDGYGIRTPVKERSAEVSPAEIDAVLVPCVAFDKRGCRLGHGKGYYDRYLPHLREDCAKILIAFDTQEVTEVPSEEADVSVDLIVTETGILRKEDGECLH